jgi:hypothetical protein
MDEEEIILDEENFIEHSDNSNDISTIEVIEMTDEDDEITIPSINIGGETIFLTDDELEQFNIKGKSFIDRDPEYFKVLRTNLHQLDDLSEVYLNEAVKYGMYPEDELPDPKIKLCKKVNFEGNRVVSLKCIDGIISTYQRTISLSPVLISLLDITGYINIRYPVIIMRHILNLLRDGYLFTKNNQIISCCHELDLPIEIIGEHKKILPIQIPLNIDSIEGIFEHRENDYNLLSNRRHYYVQNNAPGASVISGDLLLWQTYPANDIATFGSSVYFKPQEDRITTLVDMFLTIDLPILDKKQGNYVDDVAFNLIQGVMLIIENNGNQDKAIYRNGKSLKALLTKYYASYQKMVKLNESVLKINKNTVPIYRIHIPLLLCDDDNPIMMVPNSPYGVTVVVKLAPFNSIIDKTAEDDNIPPIVGCSLMTQCRYHDSSFQGINRSYIYLDTDCLLFKDGHIKLPAGKIIKEMFIWSKKDVLIQTNIIHPKFRISYDASTTGIVFPYRYDFKNTDHDYHFISFSNSDKRFINGGFSSSDTEIDIDVKDPVEPVYLIVVYCLAHSQ